MLGAGFKLRLPIQLIGKRSGRVDQETGLKTRFTTRYPIDHCGRPGSTWLPLQPGYGQIIDRHRAKSDSLFHQVQDEPRVTIHQSGIRIHQPPRQVGRLDNCLLGRDVVARQVAGLTRKSVTQPPVNPGSQP